MATQPQLVSARPCGMVSPRFETDSCDDPQRHGCEHQGYREHDIVEGVSHAGLLQVNVDLKGGADGGVGGLILGPVEPGGADRELDQVGLHVGRHRAADVVDHPP